jgi:ADP-ribose pyrophosphatase YjhB (NUDIX family)
MAYVGQGDYGVVALPFKGSKASYIKLVLPREPRSGKSWFPAASILPNQEAVDAAVRKLFEETGHTLTVNDLTLLSNNPVQVPLHDGTHQLVCVFAASVSDS